MFLNELKKQQRGRIVGFKGQLAVTQRLMAMGMLPGRAVEVVQVAPFGDPVTVQLDSSRVSLRRSEAAMLQVEPA